MQPDTSDVPGVTICDHTKACCCTKCVPQIHHRLQEKRGREAGYRNRMIGCGRPTLDVFLDEKYGTAYLEGWDKANRAHVAGLARERRLVVLTAQADDGDIRAETV